MISELTFARKFTSFWNQTLPNANNFIRIINGSLIKNTHPPLNESPKKENNVFVNECAFNLFAEIKKGSIKNDFLQSEDFFISPEFHRVFEHTKEYLKKFSYGSNFQLPLTLEEYLTIKEISQSLHFRFRSMESLEVSPLFDGCGVINNSYGDLYYPFTLVEVKSGDRKFSTYDLRQTLIYLTLNFYSKNRRDIKWIELFNPRMGIFYNDTVISLCRELAFIQPEELFFSIMNSITEENFMETEMQR